MLLTCSCIAKTIHRAAKDFLAAGLIAEVNLPRESQRYTARISRHFHYFLCRLCDKAFDVEGCPGTLKLRCMKYFSEVCVTAVIQAKPLRRNV